VASHHWYDCAESAPSILEGLLASMYVYMIKNSIDKLYVGVTENPQDRVAYHNKQRGAKFTKYRPDFKIVFLEKYATLAEARKREIQIKKWSRVKKEMLVSRYKIGLPTKQN
jgi:putative endonuclease